MLGCLGSRRRPFRHNLISYQAPQDLSIGLGGLGSRTLHNLVLMGAITMQVERVAHGLTLGADLSGFLMESTSGSREESAALVQQST